MRARDIMMRYPKTLRPDDPLELAAQIMAWAGIRHLPVVHGDRLIGLLTEQELVVHQARQPDTWKTDTVANIMRTQVQTAHPDDGLTEMTARMAEHKIGCLPVIELGKLAGIVTTTDILRHQVRISMSAVSAETEPAGGRTVRDVMTPNPEAVHPDDHLLDAAGRMQMRRIRHLPVVDGELRVIGMLSDRDIRAAIGDPTLAQRDDGSPGLELMRVSDAMSTPPVTTTPDRSCSQVARELATLSASAVPVTDEAGKLLGMLSYVDVLRGLTER